MKRVRTISLSLEPDQIEQLDELAKEAGSRSKAVRLLLSDRSRARAERESEEAYREYHSDPANVAADAELTKEMMTLSSWLRPGKQREGKRARSRRTQG